MGHLWQCAVLALSLSSAYSWTQASCEEATLPPSCDRKIYCDSKLLHHVQIQSLYTDSKTFVDFKMLADEEEILEKFDQLLVETEDNPSVEQLSQFVNKTFSQDSGLDVWVPTDFTDNPPFLENIKDTTLRQFGKDLVSIWPTLGRKVKDDVHNNPLRYSLVPIPNGFIIPGGRFQEIYYWDSFWIIEGLLISGMTETARGKIENLLHLVEVYGHVPNGNRVYYAERSQPPLLTAMVQKYYETTGNLTWVKQHIATVETEIKYWLKNQTVLIDVDGEQLTLLRYFAQSLGPRPESYREDYLTAQEFPEDQRQDVYTDVKSAAESGWDFSTRWFISENGSRSESIKDIHARRIIPVDLNAIYAGALETLGDLYGDLKDRRNAQKYWSLAEYWRKGIDSVLWDEEDGIWYDYDSELKTHRKYFYPSNVSPLWANAVDESLISTYAPRVLAYLDGSKGLNYPGGVPTSLVQSGEQWDFPNAWPPLESILINALYNSGHAESQDRAIELAQIWVRANYKGYNEKKVMFEKYDVEQIGVIGGGGEYTPQTGFGWSNGVVLELLDKFGDLLTLVDE